MSPLVGNGNNMIDIVLTRSQWILKTTRDLKASVVTLMASPFGITMAFEFTRGVQNPLGTRED